MMTLVLYAQVNLRATAKLAGQFLLWSFRSQMFDKILSTP